MSKKTLFVSYLMLCFLVFLSLMSNVSAIHWGSRQNFPGTAVDDNSIGTVEWKDPDVVKICEDNKYAVAFFEDEIKEYSHYLWLDNFGFSINNKAIIDGFKVYISRYAKTKDSIKDYQIKLVKNGSIVGNNHVSGYWSTTYEKVVYGSNTDLWGETWNASDVNNQDFGVVISVSGIKSSAYIDCVSIEVFYHEYEAPEVDAENPINNSYNVCIMRSNLSINVSDPDGHLMDISIKLNNSDWNVLYENVGNGTYVLDLPYYLFFDTKYKWWVNVSDVFDTTNVSFVFNTMNISTFCNMSCDCYNLSYNDSNLSFNADIHNCSFSNISYEINKDNWVFVSDFMLSPILFIVSVLFVFVFFGHRFNEPIYFFFATIISLVSGVYLVGWVDDISNKLLGTVFILFSIWCSFKSMIMFMKYGYK